MGVPAQISPGDWVWSEQHQELCRLIETQAVWGKYFYRVWVPTQNIVVQISQKNIKLLTAIQPYQISKISYIVSAARIADTLTQDFLLAPVESAVIPLPHQIRVLARALSGERVRYLLADEVGLGKTIEAGLIMQELKLRGLVKRVLVVAPKGLVTQWVSEMSTHFHEDFRLFIPGEFEAYRHFLRDDNIWKNFDQIICSMDSVKPIDNRRGWSRDRIQEYNQDRFEDIISAGWDLIIIDEARELYRHAIIAAESHGKLIYEELFQLYQNRLSQKRQRGEYSFGAQRGAIRRVGLAAVREYRLKQLEREEGDWLAKMSKLDDVIPELVPLLSGLVEFRSKVGTANTVE